MNLFLAKTKFDDGVLVKTQSGFTITAVVDLVEARKFLRESNTKPFFDNEYAIFCKQFTFIESDKGG